VEPIPKPELLDARRTKTDDREEMTAEEHRGRAQLLDQALQDSCEYAEQLWDELDSVRRYLLDSLPPDPRAPGAHETTCASPTGPDDEKGWDRWVATFAAVTSALCGPHGDSGFGYGRARDEERVRRSAPTVLVQAGRARSDATARPAEVHRLVRYGSSDLIRAGGLLALIALAVRGLRPLRYVARATP
jgi:hypothetical protein